MSSPAVHNFMRQQGFTEEPADACDMHFEGLYYQPRRVFPAIVVAIVLQLVSVPVSAALFFLVSAVLWWNTLLPARNPFEIAYNRRVAAPRGLQPLVPAPGPRRFAQGMAAAMTLGTGLALACRADDARVGSPGHARRRLLAPSLREVLPRRVRVPPAEGPRRVRQLDPALGARLSPPIVGSPRSTTGAGA